MSRLATPPAHVPTLTDIVRVLPTPSAGASVSTPMISFSAESQRKIVSQVVQRLGKSLKTRLRKAGQQPGGMNRSQLVVFVCNEVEQVVGSAIDQALARHIPKDAGTALKNQILKNGGA